MGALWFFFWDSTSWTGVVLSDNSLMMRGYGFVWVLALLAGAVSG